MKSVPDRVLPRLNILFFSLEMTNQVSGVILLLMTSLRQTYSGDNKKDNDPKESNSNNETFISILDGGGAGDSKGKLYSAALQAILKGLVMWIIGEEWNLFFGSLI